jgi:hypothetical protein
MNQTREELVQKRKELVTRLAAIRADLSKGLDRDFEEQAIQLENIEVLEEIARLAEEQIATIDNQLAADGKSS